MNILGLLENAAIRHGVWRKIFVETYGYTQHTSIAHAVQLDTWKLSRPGGLLYYLNIF